jgi:hypothetical protein
MVMQPTMIFQWSSIIPKSKDIEERGTDDNQKVQKNKFDP